MQNSNFKNKKLLADHRYLEKSVGDKNEKKMKIFIQSLTAISDLDLSPVDQDHRL